MLQVLPTYSGGRISPRLTQLGNSQPLLTYFAHPICYYGTRLECEAMIRIRTELRADIINLGSPDIQKRFQAYRWSLQQQRHRDLSGWITPTDALCAEWADEQAMEFFYRRIDECDAVVVAPFGKALQTAAIKHAASGTALQGVCVNQPWLGAGVWKEGVYAGQTNKPLYVLKGAFDDPAEHQLRRIHTMRRGFYPLSVAQTRFVLSLADEQTIGL